MGTLDNQRAHLCLQSILSHLDSRRDSLYNARVCRSKPTYQAEGVSLNMVMVNVRLRTVFGLGNLTVHAVLLS